jgi:oligopeptide transport system ATP-binding protein
MSNPLLQVKNLKKYFPVQAGFLSKSVETVKAVDGISFSVDEGKSFGLVGESGSGKTTVAWTILRLIDPTEGEILFENRDIAKIPEKSLKRLRRHMQMIFQDPHSSLNPRKTIFKSVAEPLIVHERMRGKPLRNRVEELLEIVGLEREHTFRFPHELSGGQKQRVGIARALALNPKMLFLDEPTSALDVSVQAQTLNFLEELQEKFALTYLFISHNLVVIRYVCDTVAVMYLGKIVETALTEELFQSPKHPYTKALIAAIPLPQARQPEIGPVLEGDIPIPINIPPGCRFHTRCHEKIGAICHEIEPPPVNISGTHIVNCHLYS